MERNGRLLTDRELKAWLVIGETDRGIGEGLTFVASARSASMGKASWVLRFRVNGRPREKVLGRYPELSLKDAREQARKDRILIERGIDVAAEKQFAKAGLTEVPTVKKLGELWRERYITPRYKHPSVVERVLRLHVDPVIGALAPKDVKPMHIDRILQRTVAGGAPTVANDALLYMNRMFKMAVRNHWIERNPAAEFEISDAGGSEIPRDRALALPELELLATAMRETPNFGRENELSIWLLLALCVRKMELLSAPWEQFNFKRRIWKLDKPSTKTNSEIEIPLADPVIEWLEELRVLSYGKAYVFPARRLVRERMGVRTTNRFPHVSPDTLNLALKRLETLEIEHFTVHDMRRTARTNMARLGVDRFVAERALNHKLKGVEGIYDRHDYFAERFSALETWASVLSALAKGAKAPDVLAMNRANARKASSSKPHMSGRTSSVLPEPEAHSQ
ncbi:tyrosine-type recombinase/integrase [Paucibacter sp. R3-3]|uniref:Tyrosine-type recombinase/integrase n=1 Tax=Roseateles agri TaxID=3098619 RepID=A0ABU5DL50_9BURK|nr:tyrosine-type recombinase/integrase [Paucibacter sp. R3-3]MDY0746433.1 tyrosine-type recombinase/integrase [Paucibacter sp. R3-3]